MPYQNYEQWKQEPITEEPHLSIVIPAYNEEERIIPTIGAIASHVSDLGFPWELIIADDGCTDNTVPLVQELNFANLNLLIAPQNGGKGSAVQRGMLAARGKYVLFADADNSTPIEQVSKFLDLLGEGQYQVAVGSRGAEGAEVENKSFFRKIMSNGLNFIVRNFFGIKVRDTQCGFKMYTQESAQHLHRLQTIMGFSFDLEILYLANKYKYEVAEIPVQWMDAPGSKVDARKEAMRFLRDLSKIKWNDIRGVYNEDNHADRNRNSIPTEQTITE